MVDRGGRLPVLSNLEEQTRITDMFLVVTVVTQIFKVVVVENNRDVGDVFGCDVFLMMNYVTILFVATLTQTTVYCTPFSNE